MRPRGREWPAVTDGDVAALAMSQMWWYSGRGVGSRHGRRGNADYA
jgi:hypothetical protein